MLVDRPDAERGRDWRGALATFVAETDRALDLLAAFIPEARALNSAETLTYLHGAISTRRHPIAVPETPMYLDAVLVDTPLVGGLEPMLGARHLRTLTVTGLPTTSRPASSTRSTKRTSRTAGRPGSSRSTRRMRPSC